MFFAHLWYNKYMDDIDVAHLIALEARIRLHERDTAPEDYPSLIPRCPHGVYAPYGPPAEHCTICQCQFPVILKEPASSFVTPKKH